MAPGAFRILVVDDDRDDFSIIRKILDRVENQTYELTWASGYDEALGILSRPEHDAVLIDYRLGEHTGLDLLENLHERGSRVPCILLTAFGDREIDMEAMRAGAVDYLDKQRLDEANLERSLRYAVERGRALETLYKREQQLLHAQKMEAIGRLAGGMAHDFNNLLTAIEGYSELVLAELTRESPLREDLEEIHSATKRAEALTKRLLAISRRQVLEPQVVDLSRFLKDFGDVLQRMVGEEIELETSLEGAVGRIFIDPGQLDQILMNLAANAAQAMPMGGKLVMTTGNLDTLEPYHAREFMIPPGRYVTLTISDTGKGMDEETMSHIFEPFFTTRESGQGTGLGLSIVYGIIKQSRGYVSVSSTLEKGTTFTIYLPQVADERLESAGPSAVRARPGPSRILVVEDEDSLRKMVGRVLEQRGYQVVEACNGRDALQLVDSDLDGFDLVLSDVVMPQMSGRELAERLFQTRPSTLVVLVSGYFQTALDEALPPNCAAVLAKPFTVTDLVRTVGRLLQESTAKSS